MRDLNPELAKIIEPICAVQLQFPDINAKFPVATLSQVTTESTIVISGKERCSLQDFQVDVWDKSQTPQNAISIAAKISDAMLDAGLRRYYGQQIDDASELQRYTMRFRGYLDEKTNTMYERV